MKVGERIHVRARKTDGTVYRSWQATIESVTTGSIVTIAPADQPVFDLYSKEFQDKMYEAANEALEIANHWKSGPVPVFP
ncbi:MAG: hypothetical protein AABZ00_03300 [Chloroflexota bacterium]